MDAAPIEVFIEWHPAERAFHRAGAAVDAVDDPLEDAEVIAEARPEELAVLIAAEPVDVEHSRRVSQAAAELEPVAEVVAHVVAAEWQHRERVAANLAQLAERGGRHFGTHRGGGVNA